MIIIHTFFVSYNEFLCFDVLARYSLMSATMRLKSPCDSFRFIRLFNWAVDGGAGQLYELSHSSAELNVELNPLPLE